MDSRPIVVVDGRVFSTDAVDRGMGRYLQFIMETIVKADFDICLILYKNSCLKNDHLLRCCKYVEYMLSDPSVFNDKDIHTTSFEIERIIRKSSAVAFIDGTPFLFPKRLDITVCPVVAIVYDLIPLRYPNEYFHEENKQVAELYENGLRRLINADFIIAISSFAKDVVIKYLGVAQDKIDVIYPSLDPIYLEEFNQINKTIDYFAILGGHFSKNPEFALNLFTELNRMKERKYMLCVPTEGQLNHLRAQFPVQTDELTIKASIKEQQKVEAQASARVIFHLSREEGFGIPLLEGIFSNTRVVCRDIKINLEILEKAQTDYHEIACLVTDELDNKMLIGIDKFIDSPISRDLDAYSKTLKNIL